MRKPSRILHPHVERRPAVCGGEPVLRGTRFPARSVVEYVIRSGMAPEELFAEWKRLTLAQVHDALSYHAEIDRSIRANRAARPRKASS